MVKILHFADVHLGVENYGRPDPATGLHSRLADFCRSFDELVDFALAATRPEGAAAPPFGPGARRGETAYGEPVDLVLFAGDAYKSRDPSPTHQREFARRIQRLASAGIPVFLLTGNHDLPGSAARANTLDIFSTLEVPNVTVGRTLATHRIETRGGPVQIVALPWIVRSHLLSREEHKGRSLLELQDLTLSILEEHLGKEIARLDPQVPTILAVHGTAQGSTYGSERSVMLGQELVLPLGLLRRPEFDYVALGHIHRHQELSKNPPIVYSGSLDRIDFGEEREAKGFVVVEVQKGGATYRFRPLASTRRFVTIDVKADGKDPMAQVQEAIAAQDVQDAIVRLIIHTTPAKNHLLRDPEIHELLSGAFKVASIVRDVERTARLRLGSNQGVEQMTPLQALEKYLEVHQVPQERMQKLLEYARRVANPETYVDTH